MTSGAWIALAAVVLALAFGAWRQVRDGRFKRRSPVTRPLGADLVASTGHDLGERATLLQFSSAFCAPCRATRRILGEVAGLVEGVAHVEIDAEHHLEATRALGILRTPTTVVLDASGAEVTRATGAPTRDQVLTALAQV